MNYQNKSENYYKNKRPEMQDLFPLQAKILLEVGCGEGELAFQLKEKYNIESWGVELMEQKAQEASSKLDNVIIGRIEDCLDKLPDNYFDVIYLNDVLEHLFDPKEVLINLRSKLSKDGVVISSIPNMRYYKILKQLIINKNWEYQEEGIMDFTHLKFYTSKSIKNLFLNAGYTISTHKGIRRTKSLRPYIYNIFLFFTAWDIFYLQFATVARK